ncbi:hypothetical protein SCLCIDRAFT_34247 [Scleroderma citrinum Foug A]|uniref:Uncharacterized protein n=1 Tax=Scleroderma citrinum Foug A TaxID=1036808 RepID=A0A0C2YL65_9AGAM|nr:hypothetical protein SCLCIDRAFT_34247 [Scleroderma citrinum Foug A]
MPPNHTQSIRTLRRAGPDSYTLRLDGLRQISSICLGQIQLYLTYDAAIQQKHKDHPMPLGYDAFTDHFNCDANSCNGTIKFCQVTDDGVCLAASRVTPTLEDILGEADARQHREEELEKGKGAWITKDHTRIMNKMLWDQADCTQ